MYSATLSTSPSLPTAFAANRSSLPPACIATTSTNKHHRPLSPEKLALLIDKSKTTGQLLQIHAFLIRQGFDDHPILAFKLQRSYASLGRLDYCVELFDRTQNPNVFFYTAIIHGHAFNDLHDQALHFYVRMLTQGVEPNAFTFSAVLKSCPLNAGKAIHSQAIKFGFDSDTYVGTALVDVYSKGGDVMSARHLFEAISERSLVSLTAMITCYSKHGDVDGARLLFDRMIERDVVCWNVMIDGYAQHGRPNEALALFRKMLLGKVKANEVTLVAVLSACGQLGALELGRWVHSYIANNRIQLSCQLGTALVDMYSKCGALEDAHLVFDMIKDKDVVAWNSMIVGYAMHGFTQDALRLFHNMCRTGLQPTDITFIGILSACAHAGSVSEGWRFFHLMKEEHRIQPKIEHYGCMVNLLGRAGHLDEAYELVKNLEIDPDPVLWGTLLGACRLHGNIGLGEEIAEFLVNQNLASSGTYVLLSNMYAAARNWDGVAKVRALMKGSGVQKEPGCSSIEVNNKVHEFLAGDMKHPKSKEIYMMLEEINEWLKAHGYTPQTDIVLHDIGEREKKRSLEVHSERLAIAFGLISTQPGATVKIVKNLRVCPDCHAVTKLISKITGRKIVVRDRSRFHQFVNGSCSCGDYW
ncbi:LOW QUALITY PROTEIN: pentatricopeptide repeat-containing protein ELI1, chloroplastic-like [Diospyros lotus]|uniref:LOW QUALITY PROTEIN: pentatricopeptide repeat-containing protein ELI1, chloroplastic-like n=1 Tax=Diospyros lotus TaxID=55363 RepID=UPI00224C8D50|nr:LOW QUALITY PROTEIN: pentatricopeptide repeat-containing protein ELI1, chloroplastic-like [Diospyros lotus]